MVVVCNGCTDDTANIARRFGPTVHVVESEIARKTHALNLGDQIAAVFPRIYADADIVITVDAIRALARRLERGDVLAVAPTAEINLTGCSWLVRKYYGIRSRLPSSREGIGGSGVYALSEAGRRRFGQFPDVMADDTYVRLQFKPAERETLPCVKSTVFAPRTIPRLIAVRTRAYRGNIRTRSALSRAARKQGRGKQSDAHCTVQRTSLMARFIDLLWCQYCCSVEGSHGFPSGSSLLATRRDFSWGTIGFNQMRS